MSEQIPLYLKPEQRAQLETLIKSGDAPARVQNRARILLLTDRNCCGALNLFAAFDTRTGRVYGSLAERKRQIELIGLLNQLQAQIPAAMRTIHIVVDNVGRHTGKQGQAWLARHPHFVWNHPTVYCSWMNHVEQWFGLLKRQRLAHRGFR